MNLKYMTLNSVTQSSVLVGQSIKMCKIQKDLIDFFFNSFFLFFHHHSVSQSLAAFVSERSHLISYDNRLLISF